MLFFERRETNDEILFFFIRPYLLICFLIWSFLGFLSPFIVWYWVAVIIFWIPNIFILICFFEFYKILREVRNARKHGIPVGQTGKLFSYYEPWTLSIKKT